MTTTDLQLITTTNNNDDPTISDSETDASLIFSSPRQPEHKTLNDILLHSQTTTTNNKISSPTMMTMTTTTTNNNSPTTQQQLLLQHQQPQDSPPLLSTQHQQQQQPWYSRPHTLSGLVAMLAVVSHSTGLWTFLWTTTTTTEQRTFAQDIRAGLLGSASCFLFYCMLQLADLELIRPHPAIWKLVHGITIMYLIFVVFLLAQSTPQGVDQMLQLFEPKAGTGPLPRDDSDGSYAADCSLTSWENVTSKIYDIFFVAHFVGWFVKALILRDWGLMWTCSVLFEVMEVSLQRLLPNFQECWWDRWFLDIFGCNFFGAILGMKFAEWLGAKEYDWSGLKYVKSRGKRIALHFRPRIFPRRFQWHVFSGWRRFGIACLVVFGVMLGELNGFFLKSALRIPTSSSLNVIRVVFMVPSIYASVVELQTFSLGQSERIGPTAWLVLSLGVLELLLSIKQALLRDAFSYEQIHQPDPVVVWAWITTIILFLWVVYLILIKAKRVWINAVGRAVLVPFTVLLGVDAWRSVKGHIRL
jgi:phosphatidylserine synthase 2